MTDTTETIELDSTGPSEATTTEVRLAELEGKLKAAQEEMEKFKAKVSETALAMGERHNLCDVVEETLTEIGLPLPEREHEYTVYFRTRVTAKTGGRNPDMNAVHRALQRMERSLNLDEFTPQEGDRVRELRLSNGNGLEIYDVRRRDMY